MDRSICEISDVKDQYEIDNLIINSSLNRTMLTPAGDDLEILFDVDLFDVFESLLLLPLALVDCINSLTVPSTPLMPGSTIFCHGLYTQQGNI